MEKFYFKWRSSRLINLLVINLRYVIALGFIPSGLKKIFDLPFTNPENEGIFYAFLDAFYATGLYYNMVGVMQVLAAILLITQRFATLGALLFLPIIFNIAVLTLSTIGSLTPLIALLMLLGIIFLLIWDAPKWTNIINRDNVYFTLPSDNNYPSYNQIQVYTGIFLLLLPPVLFASSLPKAGILSVPLILILGNVLSERKFPVLRRNLREEMSFRE